MRAMSEAARCIIGLGNPGWFYGHTRHNLGFRVVQRLARQVGVRLKGAGFRAKSARAQIEEQPVWLLQPLTMMNRSGDAVGPFAAHHDISAARLLVICDDIYLPLGTVRLRPHGSAGGHKGIASVIAALGADDFPRLRLGVGTPPEGVDAADYVLSWFPRAERTTAARMVERAAEAAHAWVSEGIERAMARFNGSVLESEPA